MISTGMDIIKQMSHLLLNFEWRKWFNLFLNCLTEIYFRFLGPSSYLQDLDKKAVLITGCSSGFGHSLALSLNELGIHVFAGCRSLEKQGSQDLKTKAVHPEKMHLIPIDVANEAKVEEAFKEVDQKLSLLPDVRLHAVVNNAGVSMIGQIEWGTFNTFKEVFDVNTFGPVLVSRTFLPLIRQSHGRIININSFFSRLTMPGASFYAMSKHAALSFTECLRRELFQFGVKVISIEPAVFSTQMTDDDNFRQKVEEVWQTSTPEVKESYGVNRKIQLSNFSKLGSQAANKSLDPVIQSMIHAILATHPRYHYVCADFAVKMGYYVQMITCPQEVYEFMAETLFLVSGNIANWAFKDSNQLPNGSCTGN